ncbi:histidine kinase-like ATPase [Russula earlei]|uniref:Histidine kinase-like ATPase n=1 Tax=Russula earlei TaxID=71964 RepID=A0ACC0UIU8_9AGAM|nr:histidine kinase-like ATPase [Russula earlei]
MPDVEMTEEHEREEDLMEEEMIMQAIVMSVHPEAESDVQGMWKVLTINVNLMVMNLTKQLGPHLLDPDIPDQLIGDSLRLRQVIADLVGNAIKFTPSKVSKKGHVALSCRLLALDDSSVTLEFCVLDTGIGIAKDKLNFNFDTFAQADGSTTRLFSEGIQRNGIGLSISKRLVALMAGSMRVESEIGKGSKFFTITSQIGQLSMDATLAKMAPFGNYFIR